MLASHSAMKRRHQSILHFVDEMADNSNGTVNFIFIRQLVQRLGLSGTRTENLLVTTEANVYE